MEDYSKFWDRAAKGYAKKPVPSESIYQEKLRKTQMYLTPDSKVFEFGCGTGSTALAHASYVSSILATDISSNMLDIAREKAADANVKNVTFQRDSIESFDGKPGSFDVVLGMSILHLVSDKKATLKKVHELLKEGGVFVTSTTCVSDFMKWFKYVAPILSGLRILPPMLCFSLAELNKDLLDAGFEIEHFWKPEGDSVFIVARKK